MVCKQIIVDESPEDKFSPEYILTHEDEDDFINQEFILDEEGGQLFPIENEEYEIFNPPEEIIIYPSSDEEGEMEDYIITYETGYYSSKDDVIFIFSDHDDE